MGPTSLSSYAGWVDSIQPSPLQTLLTDTSLPGAISFALGLPDPQLFPSKVLGGACLEAFEAPGVTLQYTPQSCALKRQIVALMDLRGVRCKEEQIFLTCGAQQGLSLLSRLLLNPGDTVLLEDHTYTGLLQAISLMAPRVETVPINVSDGLDVDRVEFLLRSGTRPAFIYTMSEGHNPTTATMSAEKRTRLVDVARKWGIPIIEDDAYGFLQYHDGPLRPSLRAYGEELVFYVGSFSKILAPSLRVGWIVIPDSAVVPLSVLKESSDINTTTLSQHIVSAYLGSTHITTHMAMLRRVYKDKRDQMLSALSEFTDVDWVWSQPPSGIFLWGRLGADLDGTALLRHSWAKHKLAFVPGSAFSALGYPRCSSIRLNFSNPSVAQIHQGIGRLAESVQDLLGARK